MTIREAAEKRTSRRKYIEIPIEASKLSAIAALISDINAESGLSVEFIPDASSAFKNMSRSMGWFKGVGAAFAMKGKITDRYLHEKIGYYGEKLVLECVRMGLGTCWVGGSYNKNAVPCTVQKDESLVLVITIGYVEKTKSFIEKMMTGDDKKSKSLSELLRSDSQPPDWVLKGMEMVLNAPSANNLQPVIFDFKHGLLSAGILHNTGFELVDMGIAKYHFELAASGKFELGNFGRFNLQEALTQD